MMLPPIVLVHSAAEFRTKFNELISPEGGFKVETSRALSSTLYKRLSQSPCILFVEQQLLGEGKKVNRLNELCTKSNSILVTLASSGSQPMLSRGRTPHEYMLAFSFLDEITRREMNLIVQSLLIAIQNLVESDAAKDDNDAAETPDDAAKEKAQISLRNNEERYRAFITQSSEAIWCFELEIPLAVTLPIDKQVDHFFAHSWLADCNLAYAKMYGCSTVEEVIGMRMVDSLPPEMRENSEYVRNFILNGYVLNDGGTTEVDTDGNIKYFLNNLVGITTNGHVERVWGVKRDITTLKLTERALQSAEKKFQGIFENALEGIFLSSVDGVFIDVNPAYAHMFGYDSREQLLHEVTNIAAQIYVDVDKRNEFLRILIERDTIERFESQVYRRNGETFWITESARFIRDEDGVITHIEGLTEDISERRKAEDALRESELRFRRFSQLSPDGIVVHSEGKVLFANSRILELIGATDESQVVGKNPLQFLHPESVQLVIDRIKAMSETSEPQPVAEEIFIRLDGRAIYTEVSAASLLIKGKVAYQLVVRDITERKRGEFAKEAESTILNMITGEDTLLDILNEICSQNEKLFESVLCVIFTMESTGLEIAAAPLMSDTQFQWINKVEQGELSGIAKTCAQMRFPIFVPDFAADDRWTFLRESQAEPVFNACWALPIKNTAREVIGVLGYYFAQKSQASTSDEGIAEIFANLSAIAIERRKLEAEIEKLSSVARQITNAVILLDTHMRVTWVNEGFTRLTEYTLAEVKGEVLRDFLHGSLTDTELNVIMREKLLSGEPVHYRLYHYTKGGKGYWVDIAIDLMFDRLGNHIGFIAIHNEITEKVEQEIALKEAKEKAEEANHLKSSFLANMSHEIRTPMNGILGFADILREELLILGANDLYRFAETIHTSGKRLLNLLNDILDISRIEANKLELDIAPCHLDETILKVVTLLTPLSLRKHISLEILERTNAVVLADENRLFQVLNNIIGNAIKFTAKGGVTIASHVENAGSERRVVVAVHDTGSGIEAEFLPRIFEPFMQESSGFSRSHEGSGLGLAISNRLVHLMAGSIAIDSAKGVGTKVTVTLPAAPEENGQFIKTTSHTIAKELLDTLRLVKPVVLIVEDDETSRRYFNRTLLEFTELYQAPNGPDAMEKLSELIAAGKIPDVILVDIGLPLPMNGIQLRIEMLTRFPELAATPIIAQTAYAMKDEQEALRQKGFNGLLTKPVSKNELLQMIIHYSSK